MSRHNYIVGGVPNLVTTRRPIYKVRSSQVKVNPYHWKQGSITLVQGWPFGEDMLDVDHTKKTKKIRGWDGKVKVVPVESSTIQSPIPPPTEGRKELTPEEQAIADYNDWYDKEMG